MTLMTLVVTICATILRIMGSASRSLTPWISSTEASCDYLLAFEVLEHIQDDHRAFSDWSRYLKTGGKLMVSVPAHQRHYGPSDARVGHLRRYERDDLLALLGQCGYQTTCLVNYGYPLTELSRRLSDRLLHHVPDQPEKNLAQRSLESSYTRPQLASKALALTSEGVYRPFAILQRLCYRMGWGDGIVAVAVKDP